MDSIKEFFKSIEERFTNPLFIAYILSWMAWNWPILITLGFTDTKQLNDMHYISFEDYIVKYIADYPCKFYLWPVIFAIGFTIAMPWVKTLLHWWQTKADIKKEKMWVEETGESTIPMQRYLTMREQVLQKSEVLSRMIDTESASQAKLTEQITKTQEAEAKNLELDKSLKNLKLLSEADKKNTEVLQEEFNRQRLLLTSNTSIENIFQGTWINEFQVIRIDGTIHTDLETFDIKLNTINVGGKPEFYIDEPLILNDKRFIYFKKRRVADSFAITDVYLVAVPLSNSGHNMWIGFERNSTYNISYVRYFSKYDIPNHISGLALVKSAPTDGQELKNVHYVYSLLRKLITDKNFQ